MLDAECGYHRKHDCALGTSLILKDFYLVPQIGIIFLCYGELSG